MTAKARGESRRLFFYYYLHEFTPSRHFLPFPNLTIRVDKIDGQNEFKNAVNTK